MTLNLYISRCQSEYFEKIKIKIATILNDIQETNTDSPTWLHLKRSLLAWGASGPLEGELPDISMAGLSAQEFMMDFGSDAMELDDIVAALRAIENSHMLSEDLDWPLTTRKGLEGGQERIGSREVG